MAMSVTSASSRRISLLPVAAVVDALGAVALALNLVVVLLSVFYRYALHEPIEWAEEAARVMLITTTFVGAAAALHRNQLTGIEALLQKLPGHIHDYGKAFGAIVTAIVALSLVILSLKLGQAVSGQESPGGYPQWMFVYPVTIGAAGMTVFAIGNALSLRPRILLTVFAVVLVAAIPLLFLPESAAQSLAMPVLAVSFLICLLGGVPIGFALGFASLAYMWTSGSFPLEVFAQQSIAGIDNFVLLAVPFFVLTGYVMEVNGMSIRLIDMIQRLVGRVRGGLNIVIVLSMVIFSGISGSKLADVAAVGSVLVPAARKSDQDPSDAVGLLAASAVMAETIPPCVNLIILGFVANISIGGLFMAGLAPAGLLALGLIGLSLLTAPRQAQTIEIGLKNRAKKSELLLSAGACLGMIAIIFVVYRSGLATATEISAIAALYALLVGWVIFREAGLATLYRAFTKSAALAGMVLFIIALAQTLAFILTINQIPHAIAEFMISMGKTYGEWSFVALSLLTLIVMGAVLEGAAALIIFGPLLVPVATQLGINPLHFGTLMVLGMGVGLFAPPLGLGLYACCAVGQVSIESTTRSILKYFSVLIVGIILIAFIPQISLAIPRYFGLAN